MMKTTWRTWFLALGAALSLTACSDDDNYVQPIPPQPTEAGAYVLNQGSFNLVDGTLGYLNLTAGTMSTDDLFAAANEGRSMGDTPQDLVVYGSHIYLAVYGSNVVWVLDRTTRAIEQMITTEQPRDLIAADGNVYVSNYNGYVSRIDTAQLAVDARCPVGVYPEQMAVRDGYLYVVNSFGLTSDPQGSKVSKISLANFEMEEQIEVGLNPTKIIADSRGTEVLTGQGGAGRTEIALEGLPSGLYRLMCSATAIADDGTEYEDKAEMQFILMSEDDTVLGAPVLGFFRSVAEDRPVIQIGSGQGELWAVVQLYGNGNVLLDSRTVHLEGIPGEEGSLATVDFGHDAAWPSRLSIGAIFFKHAGVFRYTDTFTLPEQPAALPGPCAEKDPQQLCLLRQDGMSQKADGPQGL